MSRKHQAGAIDDLLQIHRRKEIFDQRFAKLALRKRIRDNKAKLSIRS